MSQIQQHTLGSDPLSPIRSRLLKPARAAPAASLSKPNSVRPRRLKPAPTKTRSSYANGPRVALLLPTSAERLVELNEGQQFITSRLGETEFGAEQVAIGIQGVQQCVDAAAVP